VVIRWIDCLLFGTSNKAQTPVFCFVVAGSSHTVLVVVVIGGIVKGVPFW
jgi:chorismate synthase